MSEYIKNPFYYACGWIVSGGRNVGYVVKSIVGKISSTTVSCSKAVVRAAVSGAKLTGKVAVGGAKLVGRSVSAAYKAVKIVIGGVTHIIKTAAEYISLASNYVFEKVNGIVVDGVKLVAHKIKVGVGQVLITLKKPETIEIAKTALVIGFFCAIGVSPVIFCSGFAYGLRTFCDWISPQHSVEVNHVLRSEASISAGMYQRLNRNEEDIVSELQTGEESETTPQNPTTTTTTTTTTTNQENGAITLMRGIANTVEHAPFVIPDQLDRLLTRAFVNATPYTELKHYVSREYNKIKQLRVEIASGKDIEKEELSRYVSVNFDILFDPCEKYCSYRQWMMDDLKVDLHEEYCQMFDSFKEEVKECCDSKCEPSKFDAVFRRMQSMNNFVCSKLPVRKERGMEGVHTD